MAEWLAPKDAAAGANTCLLTDRGTLVIIRRLDLRRPTFAAAWLLYRAGDRARDCAWTVATVAAGVPLPLGALTQHHTGTTVDT